MVDTQRTLAELVALLADNNTKDISPQDVRDFLISIRRGHGQLSIGATAPTVISQAGVYVPVAGTWALLGPVFNWQDNGDGRLRYVGAAQRVVRVTASLSLSLVTSDNKQVGAAATLNGAVMPGSANRTLIGKGGGGVDDVQAVVVIGQAEIAPNDLIGLSVRNNTSTDNILAQLGTLTVTSSIN